MKKILLGLLLATLASTGWGQAKFSYFGPVNGILKGSTTTWETTQAADTDVLILWSGTCSNTTYLRGDGICSTPPGTGGGTVNSVSQTVPAGFAIGGSPVTNTGTLAITYATGQTNHLVLGTGTAGQLGLIALTTADLPLIPLASGVSGLLPVANGGTGIGTLTGLLKGNGTSAFSVAASADVIGLWTGTCSSATFLRGDGACAAPAASGTVTSVGLSWTGSGLTISGPVTTTGTLAISGTLDVAAGGIGVGTLTGLAKGNGTSAFSAAAAADVYGLWSGTCSSATFLRGDGSCAAPGGATGANPTATVGPTANNGSSTNFMRADASPAFCLTCSFTQTGTWAFTPSGGTPLTVTSPAASIAMVIQGAASTGAGVEFRDGNTGNKQYAIGSNVSMLGDFEIYDLSAGISRLQINTNGAVNIAAPSSGAALTANGAAGARAVIINGSATASQSFGLLVSAGTNASDIAFEVTNQAVTTNFINILGSGAGGIGPTSALGLGWNTAGAMTIAAPTSGVALTLTGIAGSFSEQINGSATGNGLQVAAGSTGSHVAFNIQNGAVTKNYFTVLGNGEIDAGPSGNSLVIGSAGNLTVNVPTSGISLGINGAANSYAENIVASSTTGQSLGLRIQAGTNSSDFALGIANAAGSATLFALFGDGGVNVGSPTGGDKGAGSINAQSIFVNNSAVCLASGTNCPGAASLHYAAATFSLSGSSCSVINGVGISTCTWAATGNATVFFTSGLFTSASTVNCVGTASGGSTTQFTNNTPSGSGGSVNTNVFTFNGAGIAVNGGFTLICLGT